MNGKKLSVLLPPLPLSARAQAFSRKHFKWILAATALVAVVDLELAFNRQKNPIILQFDSQQSTDKFSRESVQKVGVMLGLQDHGEDFILHRNMHISSDNSWRDLVQVETGNDYVQFYETDQIIRYIIGNKETGNGIAYMMTKDRELAHKAPLINNKGNLEKNEIPMPIAEAKAWGVKLKKYSSGIRTILGSRLPAFRVQPYPPEGRDKPMPSSRTAQPVL